MSIPKEVHFFWLSGDPYDKVTARCIDSWHKYLGDYKINKWDYEKCKDIIDANTFAREAYSVKKWAFVSDYLRLYVLYNYGGVYMDADIQVVKSLNKFLVDKAFTCYETKNIVAATLIGAEKGNPWIKMLLDYYEDRHFIQPDGSYDMRPNPGIITDITKTLGFDPQGQDAVLDVGVHIYPKEYFCPIDIYNKKNDCYTQNTHAIHLFNGSWQPRWRHYASRLKKILGIDPRKLLGGTVYDKLIKHK